MGIGLVSSMATNAVGWQRRRLICANIVLTLLRLRIGIRYTERCGMTRHFQRVLTIARSFEN